jgi:E3 ubiquitin-protein ligase DOA10
LGLDENGNFSGKGLSSLRNLINQLETSKSIPEGIIRTSDGKGGKFADVELEKQVLSEWLATWGGQSKITDLDMLADISVIREKINTYLSTDADLSTHARRAELAMINEQLFSSLYRRRLWLNSNTVSMARLKDYNSIAPKEQNRVPVVYSAWAELCSQHFGARVLDE